MDATRHNVYSVSRRSFFANAEMSYRTTLSIFDYKCNWRIRLNFVEENCIKVNITFI